MAYVIAVGPDTVKALRVIPGFPHDVFAVRTRREAEAYAKAGDSILETNDWDGEDFEIIGCAHCVVRDNKARMP